MPVRPRTRRFRQFEDSFQRSRKGNLWAAWKGRTLSVFERCDGMFGWCISDSEGPYFSAENYVTEQEALGALFEEVLER